MSKLKKNLNLNNSSKPTFNFNHKKIVTPLMPEMASMLICGAKALASNSQESKQSSSSQASTNQVISNQVNFSQLNKIESKSINTNKSCTETEINDSYNISKLELLKIRSQLAKLNQLL